MHDSETATAAYMETRTLLRQYGILAKQGEPGYATVTVPWHPTWQFGYLELGVDAADAAVERARAALPAWRADIEPRRLSLRRAADALDGKRDAFARLITFENGKLWPAAAMEVGAAIGSLRLLAETSVAPEVLRDTDQGTLRLVREPVGVVIAITPANMPLLMLVNKLATAMVTGNTLVAKPSPYTPLSALLLEQVIAPMFPPGVFQVVPGDASIGARLVEHPGTNLITLTGSRRAGKAVMAAAASSLKRVHLELGGNDPAIILPDADIEAIAEQIFRSAFASSGQACVATKRVYVPSGLHDALVSALGSLASAARVGSPFDDSATHPALTNIDQFARVRSLIDGVDAAGGAVSATATAPDGPGYFVPPTIVTGLRGGSELVDEEQFGPVLPVIPYDDLDQVIDEVNAGPFGLGATVWTQQRDRSEDLARRLDVGMVWVNRTPLPDPSLPFGGMKESGIGREGGAAGIDAFCELKTIGTVRNPHGGSAASTQ